MKDWYCYRNFALDIWAHGITVFSPADPLNIFEVRFDLGPFSITIGRDRQGVR